MKRLRRGSRSFAGRLLWRRSLCWSIRPRRSGAVSVFYDRQDELEKHEFMMGEARGRLAVTLDVLTDALVLVGQHGVYCTSERNPKVPALDLQAVVANITGAKELVASVMEKLRAEKEAREASGSTGLCRLRIGRWCPI